MSHIASISIEVRSLDALAAAAERLGGTLNRDQKTFKWYYGQDPCDHAISFSDCEYDVGVVGKNDAYELKYDDWRSGGLYGKLGKNAGLIKQAYAVEVAKTEARKKGWSAQEQQGTDGKIRLMIEV